MRNFDVAIIGCGPVGALAANLAGRAGLSALVIDRDRGTFPLPRAVHLDHEMMRLFQDAGLAGELHRLMRETQGHLHVGADHGVIRYMGTAGRPRPFGWANDYFFYQPEIEAALRHGLARFPKVTFRAGVELVRFEQEDERVVLHLAEVGADGEKVSDDVVGAAFVIACDGARSPVRKALDIPLDDLNFEEPWLVVDVEADGPVRFPELWGVPETADVQELSVMMCDPARPATIVPGRGKLRRWEFMLLPGEDDDEMTRPESVNRLLDPYLANVPHRVVRAATYRFHGLIAERWSVGRIHLAGDAVHQTPPFFGQGMCHGMRDAANLIWKMALIQRGAAPLALLDTYQSERDPQVRSVVQSAVAAGRYICELAPEKAAVRDREMRARAAIGGHETAADLIVPYTHGLVLAGSPGAGERFIQPRIGDGAEQQLLDDAVGRGWRLFLAGDEPQWAGPLRAIVAELRVTTIAVNTLEDGGAVAEWLGRRAMRAVLVRPDHYVFGTSGDDGTKLLNAVAAKLDLLPAYHAAAL